MNRAFVFAKFNLFCIKFKTETSDSQCLHIPARGVRAAGTFLFEEPDDLFILVQTTPGARCRPGSRLKGGGLPPVSAKRRGWRESPHPLPPLSNQELGRDQPPLCLTRWMGFSPGSGHKEGGGVNRARCQTRSRGVRVPSPSPHVQPGGGARRGVNSLPSAPRKFTRQFFPSLLLFQHFLFILSPPNEFLLPASHRSDNARPGCSFGGGQFRRDIYDNLSINLQYYCLF